jgi:four helix bundle protein
MEEPMSGGGRGEAPRERSYRDLIAWQKAMAFGRVVYEATHDWPRDELFGLTSQVRRAAVSIPSNIAEGQGRRGPKELLHHLWIAHGSLCEVETQLQFAEQLGYLDNFSLTPLLDQAAEVGRVLRGLINSVR